MENAAITYGSEQGYSAARRTEESGAFRIRRGSTEGKRIALLANGTRGDIQPLIAVGDALRRRGHSVVMSVNTNLVKWAKKSGLEIVSLPMDSEAMMKSEGGKAMLASGKAVTFAEELGRQEREANAEIDRALLRCCQGADLIVSTVLTAFRGQALAEALGIPHRLLSTVPVVKTGAYANILSPVRRFPLRALNRYSYDFIGKLWWKSFADKNAESRAALGLAPHDGVPDLSMIESVSIYSGALMPGDPERGAQHQVAGFVKLPAELRAELGEGALPEGLLEWVDGGTPPVFFGFGSMPVLDPAALVRQVAEITAQRGLRALVGAGWSEYGGTELPAHVRIAPAFDHDRVLPLCRAAVHHGGAGTTAAALRAGLPSLIISCFADQPFWGWRLSEIGVGATFPYQRLSSARLSAGLDRILAPEVAQRARALSETLCTEDGAGRAADAIEGWLGQGARARAA